MKYNRSGTSAGSERLRGQWPFMLALFFSMLPLGAGPHGATEGSGLRQFVLVLLFLGAAFTVLRFPNRLHLLRDSMPITMWLLLIYVGASVAWSPEPWVSFKRYIQVLGVVLLGAALLVGGNGRPRIHSVVPPVLWAGMLLALLVTAVAPGFAFSDIGYRGFMATKNNFGQLAVLCALMPLALMRMDPKARRWLWWPLVALGFVGLGLSRSTTAVVALALVLGMVLLGWVTKRLHRSWIPVLLVMVMSILVAVLAAAVVYGVPSMDRALGSALAPTGKDLTLSGRTYLWELMVRESMKHPWFGVGYGGFWLGLEGASGQIAYLVQWGYPGQAHNGYLDLFNELGLVGFLFFLAFAVQHGLNLARLSRMNPSVASIHTSLFALMLILNLAEATFLRTTHIWWLVFAASVFEVGHLSKQRDWRTAPLRRYPLGAATT